MSNNYSLWLGEDYAQLVLQGLNDTVIVAVTDIHGTIVYVNDAFVQISGYSREELLGQNHRKLKSGYHDELFYRHMWKTISQGKVWQGEICNRAKDGRLYWEYTIIVPLKDQRGKPEWYVSIRVDITRKKEMERQALFDPLTGLGNRRFGKQLLAELINQRQLSQQPLAVFIVDLDRFKLINDAVGHETGDLLLRMVAERLQEALADCGTVCRHDGDEFMLLINECEREDFAFLFKHIRTLLSQPYQLKDSVIRLKPYMGGALYPKHGTEAADLVRKANLALYLAKQKQAHDVVWFDKVYEQRFNPLLLEQEMHRALASNQFYLLYQPQVHLRTKALVGFEALVRWQHPRWGLINPSQFLDVAEQSGLIIQLGEWVMRQAMTEFSQSPFLARQRLSINLSMGQFVEERLSERLQAASRATGFPLEQLTVELTESMLGDYERAVGQLSELTKLGVRVAVDDFGTGYSSLSRLIAFPLHELKIDRSFVQQIGSERGEALVRSIINLARLLELEVVAEGIEREEQLRFLRRHYCQVGQGFLFAKPMAAHALALLLEEYDRN